MSRRELGAENNQGRGHSVLWKELPSNKEGAT